MTNQRKIIGGGGWYSLVTDELHNAWIGGVV